jgi:sulfur relay protein TusB/DsrH
LKGTLILTGRLVAEDPRIGLLFTGDGVFSLVEGSRSRVALSYCPSIELFGCRQDIEARGIGERIQEGVRKVNYEQIVELVMADFAKTVSYF